MKSNKRLLIITPLFFGDGSGASIYYQLLASELMKEGFEVSVISDEEEGVFSGGYFPFFKKRAGQKKRKFYDLVAYFHQNIAYIKMIFLTKKLNPDFILVHSSFYNHISIFPFFVNQAMKLTPNAQWTADVRDKLLPSQKLNYLNNFFNVIACSDNVRNYLIKNNIDKDKVSTIPVIQAVIDSRNKNSDRKPVIRQYIIYVGAVKEDKAVDLLLDAYVDFVRPFFPKVDFIVVGLDKSSAGSRIKNLLDCEGVKYLGKLSHIESLSLMSNAMLCVNISPIESISRVSLEAISLQKPTLLPPNIPEYQECCPEFVVSEMTAPAIGCQMRELLESQAIPNYPVINHSPDVVMKKYLTLFGAS